jgi:hypothetical protein
MTPVELVLLPPAVHSAPPPSADPMAVLVLAVAIVVLAGGPWLELCIHLGRRLRPAPAAARPRVRGVL